MDSLLLVKPGSLGDVVHALPVAAELHRVRPELRLTWVVDPRWEPVLRENPSVAGTLAFPREKFRGAAGLGKAVAWYAGLRSLRASVAVDLQCLLRSALIGACARAQRRIGLSDAREGARWLYGAVADVSGIRHAVDRYLAVLPLLGVAVPSRPEFPLGPGEPVAGFATRDFTLLHPYARGAGKSLSPRQVAELCRKTSRQIVLAGVGPSIPGLPAQVIDLANRTTLSQLVWLIRRASAVVSVDSGPMHLAAAAGVPLLSIHTWSDPRKVGPYSDSASIWQGGEIRKQDLGGKILPEQPVRDRDLEAIGDWIQSPA